MRKFPIDKQLLSIRNNYFRQNFGGVVKKTLLASLIALVFPAKTDTAMFKEKSVAPRQTDVFEIPEGELLVRDVPYGFAIVSHKISKDKFR